MAGFPTLLALLAALLALVVAAALLWRRRTSVHRQPPAIPTAPSQRAVVLVHGVLGFRSFELFGRRHHYFRQVAHHLERTGHPVYTVQLAPLGSVPRRAEQLARFVRALAHDRCYLIAHSMGGLDARYAISRLGLASRVAALVTVGTPHRGTPVADVAHLPPVAAARRLLHLLGLRTEAFDWLTTRNARDFNRLIADVPGVAYCSVVARPAGPQHLSNPLLRLGHRFLWKRAGANDGMVPASSQVWGEILEHTHADHWAQIGWSRHFPAHGLYERIIAALRDRGL